jgi:hypothetical protein
VAARWFAFWIAKDHFRKLSEHPIFFDAKKKHFEFFYFITLFVYVSLFLKI